MLAEIPAFFTQIFPWPFVAIGGAVAYKAIRKLTCACGSKRWPTVEGTVTLAKIEVSDSAGDYAHNLYAPVIEFKFVVDGALKTSRKIAMTDLNPGGEARAEAVLKCYKTGSKVKVYCSPRDPEMNILEPGMRWPMLGKLVFGLLLSGAGIAMLLVFGSLGPMRSW
ncbi:hypothetical protein BH11VER1_BH11VER1_09680 [soil metagenome]